MFYEKTLICLEDRNTGVIRDYTIGDAYAEQEAGASFNAYAKGDWFPCTIKGNREMGGEMEVLRIVHAAGLTDLIVSKDQPLEINRTIDIHRNGAVVLKSIRTRVAAEHADEFDSGLLNPVTIHETIDRSRAASLANYRIVDKESLIVDSDSMFSIEFEEPNQAFELSSGYLCVGAPHQDKEVA